MRRALVAGLILLWTGCICAQTVAGGNGFNDAPTILASALSKKQWIHGSVDCKSNTDPAIEIFSYDPASFILRQNKCLSYEAPFIYVLIGDDVVFVLDTGATANALDFPLYETVRSLIQGQSGKHGETAKKVLVVHSHSHSDHYTGDSQFVGKPNVTLIEPNYKDMTRFFSFDNWPYGEAGVELGGRTLTIIPTPGHQEEAISVYDSQTKWLLTGDTFYPGYIYVKNWDEYKRSIARLATFANTHEVSTVLGAHIEMTEKAGEYYPIGTIYQPNEAALALPPASLFSLNSELAKTNKKQEIVMDELIVAPMSTIQRTISNIARWIVQ